MRMQHVMIDLETLDTTAGAVIMSIGGVKFDLDSDEMDDKAYYASVSIESNLAAHRTISESTLLWWLKQSPEAQAVFHEPKQSLNAALDGFSAWFGKSTFVWSKGADFDISMLAHAYRGQGWETPWDFFNARCVRTYSKLPCAKNIVVPNALKHNALQDAIAQVKLVQAIQKKLNSQHPMVKA